MWSPITLRELSELISTAVVAMETPERRLWELVRVSPRKWQQHPWGDEGNGFWVVGIVGQRAIWYNDIEGGFNVSFYANVGELSQYWCNQDELQHVIWWLGQYLATGEPHGGFGPPHPGAG